MTRVGVIGAGLMGTAVTRRLLAAGCEVLASDIDADKPAVIARAAGVLDAIVARRYDLGAIGNASRAKLAVNLILGLNRAALAEGLVFASRLRLDPVAFLDVARGSAAYSQVMNVKGELFAKRDY